MIRKKLGKTGLEVTPLGFGAMEVRGPKVWGGRNTTDEQAETILNAVLDAGINFVDTAVDYGLSEERIGRYISSRRNEFFLATKCGCNPQDVGDHFETPHLWTRDNLLKNIHGSLQRMKTDHVDLLQLHNPKPEDVRAGKLVEALQEIRAQGLARFIGISSTLPFIPEYAALGVFDTFQIPYSCLEPQHHDAISTAADSGAGVIIRGGIGHGGPRDEERWKPLRDLWQNAGLPELLGGMSPQEFILRYTLSHPHCGTVIVGTLNPEHLKANVSAAEKGPLPPKVYHDARARIARALKDRPAA